MMHRTRTPLPWEEVKAADPMRVAELLGLARARERNKYGCVSCDSSDALHAYAHKQGGGGFHCFSCGQTWSNVDAAAVRWGLEPADACRQLAEALGLRLPEPATRAARSSRTPARATAGAAAGAARRSGTGGGAGSGAPGGGQASATRTARTVRPTKPARTHAPDPKAEARAEVEAMRAEGMVSCTPPFVYAAALARLELTERGAEYLAGRGFDPAEAHAYGFRSLDGARDWLRLAEALEEEATPAMLELAGFYARPKDDPTRPPHFAPPFRAPALLIPFRAGAEVVGVRFRNLAPDDKRNRYRDLLDTRPPLPFHADALRAEELHVVEGELNAYTLRLYGLAAVGVPGASGWREGWAPMMKPAGRLALWYDNDEAGDRGARQVAARLQEAHGSAWVKEHARRVRLPADANDLHTRGELRERIERAAWLD